MVVEIRTVNTFWRQGLGGCDQKATQGGLWDTSNFLFTDLGAGYTNLSVNIQ